MSKNKVREGTKLSPFPTVMVRIADIQKLEKCRDAPKLTSSGVIAMSAKGALIRSNGFRLLTN
jgi:hypothetical protein